MRAPPSRQAALGQALGIEAPAAEFREDTYQCQMVGLHATGPHTVSGKFRKASGRVEGINLHGRPTGTMAWQLLGRFTATPFSASVPLAGAGPQAWECQARAVRRDEEFGLPSDIQKMIVRP